MKVLLINGYQKHIDSNGKLNQALFSIYLSKLRDANFDIKISSVQDYNPTTEVNKFLWADLIIFQFPIYWFNVPGSLKQYLDDVLMYKVFYEFSNHYGDGGLMKGKKYLLSTTWNAPDYSFSDKNEFFDGKSVDDVLASMNFAMKYCGFKPFSEKSISFHDVVKNPNYKNYKENVEKFIDEKIIEGR